MVQIVISNRISNNAANIGFAASYRHWYVSRWPSLLKLTSSVSNSLSTTALTGSGFVGCNDFCNRNSKISLSGSFGEFMVGQWLLPHNEMVAQDGLTHSMTQVLILILQLWVQLVMALVSSMAASVLIFRWSNNFGAGGTFSCDD